MENNEINDKLESYQKQLEDFAIQMEALTNSEDPSTDEVQSQMDYLMRRIEETTAEIENLIPKL